jgi:hypothetical protein
MTDLGPLSFCLGLQIQRERGVISIRQSHFIQDVLKKFGLQDCKPVSTPISSSAVDNLFVKVEHEDFSLGERYRSALGSVMFAMLGTRPDIAFAVGLLGRFASRPGQVHWQAMKHLLRYLKGTTDFKLTYGQVKGSKLVGYSDADWAGDKQDRKSTSGYLYFLSGGPVTWRSKKQTTVALSSTEAEYIGLSEAAKEAMWLMQLASDLGINFPSIKVFEDNQGSIFLADHPVSHQRTKHIDVRYHFVRHLVVEGNLEIKYLPTEEMVADLMTKALPKDKHEKFSKILRGDSLKLED